VWAPRPVWTTRRGETSCPTGDSNSDLSVVQPAASRHTDYAIPSSSTADMSILACLNVTGPNTDVYIRCKTNTTLVRELTESRPETGNNNTRKGISGFLDFIHPPVFEETRRFGNSICFRPQVKRGKKTPTRLGPLERANLNHWTNPVRFTQLFNHLRPG
jgi:hypothetical protein